MRADLTQILSIFEGLDRHLDAVDAVVARMERRIAAAVRYMDRPDPAAIERTAAALRAVGPRRARRTWPRDLAAAPADRHAAPSVAARRARRRSRPRRCRIFEIDPVIEAFVEAKAAFRRRTTVTAESMTAFLDRISAGRHAARLRRSPSPTSTPSSCSSACARSTCCSRAR